jgi:hypothetical protein
MEQKLVGRKSRKALLFGGAVSSKLRHFTLVILTTHFLFGKIAQKIADRNPIFVLYK